MSWPRAYRVALHLLPAELRRKHGPAMEALFARELERARGEGRLHGALAGAAGVWDAVRRGAYEQVRPRRVAADRHGRSTEPWSTHPPLPQPAGATHGGPHMPQPTRRDLLRRLAVAFAVALGGFTVLLPAQYAIERAGTLLDRGEGAATIVRMVLLSLPFIAALTIPMAVLVSVLWVFTRLGRDGTLAAARRERDGVRRLALPVLGAAAVAAALAFGVTAEVVPRTNARLSALLAGDPRAPEAGYLSDREMTIPQLREAARAVRPGTPNTAVFIAGYEIEVQKKLALPTSCILLALAGMAIAFRVPRGGAGLTIGASVAIFGAYYVLLVTGEELAQRSIVSPLVGMWAGNALLLAVALLAAWRRAPAAPAGRQTPVIAG